MTLSITDQVRELKASGVQVRAESYWEDKLDEWLAAALPPGAIEWWGYEDFDGERDFLPDETDVQEWTDRQREGVQTWCFPTAGLREEYLTSIHQRRDTEVMALLRLFLFEESCFGKDTDLFQQALTAPDSDAAFARLPMEYRRKLWRYMGRSGRPHPSIRWVLDLLPHSPQHSINAIMGYLKVYESIRPTGRSMGLYDATLIIRARWINTTSGRAEALANMTPRDVERLVAALYRSHGYHVELTPPSKDGGRDVIATRTILGQREVVLIEAKRRAKVGVEEVRKLRGAVSRDGVNRGVLVTTGSFKRGALSGRERGDIIEVIAGPQLIEMLNASFGYLWVEDLEAVCSGLV